MRRDVDRALAADPPLLDRLEESLSSESLDALERDSGWFARNRPFLSTNADGRLEVDLDAKAFGTPIEGPDFLRTAVDALASGEIAARGRARRLLSRYAPGGPGEWASEVEWRDWMDANAAVSFFSELAGYVWLVDEPARAAGLPSSQFPAEARTGRRPGLEASKALEEAAMSTGELVGTCGRAD